MPFHLHAIGKRMPGWINAATDEYAKRLPSHWQFALKEYAQAQGSTASVIMGREAELLLASIPSKGHVIALDSKGNHWSTEQLSKRVEHWQSLGKPIYFLIGGADGLDVRCRERANETWSLSALTFPHPMVRVIVLEQLYRAYSLTIGHPYHRA